ncbi:MAG: hypothetical protein ACFFFC_06915 [Candidatus Thorarchaeota archaeon]
MREDDRKEEDETPAVDDRERLAARIPITEWYDIERKMAIISRMSTEPAREPIEGAGS